MKWIKEFFCEVMLNGYVRGKTSKKEGRWPEYAQACLGDYVIIDEWSVTPQTDYFQGQTTISFKGRAVWRMTYEGRYPKEVTEFLKMSLLKACEHGEFWGGRGPFRFSQGSWEYRNSAEQGRFEEFSGREQILIGENEVGHCTFKGGLI